MALFAVCVTVMAQTPLVKGDVNGDGVVTAADVTALYDSMLGNVPGGDQFDVNGDGVVTAADVTALYDYLLGNVPSGDEHEYVDLGLPSGTLWAKTNVGADSPEDYDDYFAWGEIAPKDTYNEYDYLWYEAIEFGGDYLYKITKYSTDSDHGYNGFVDNKTELDAGDDAATANWGPGWCMPSNNQFQELIDNCTSQWTTVNGVNGRMFTSNINGATLFFPAIGYCWGGGQYNVGTRGIYGSRTLRVESPNFAYHLSFDSGSVYCDGNNFARYYGLSVRAVRVP